VSHPLINPVHKFFIPVMGTGFTIDTPLRVARYGISSVVSLVDDVLIEQMRSRIAAASDRVFEAIEDRDEDSRARRITAYLDMMHDLVQEQIAQVRHSAFTAGSEITRYFEMLPPSPLRAAYDRMLAVTDPQERQRLQEALRERIVPGGIDVNIMTKLDRVRLSSGKPLDEKFSDAMSALRGFARSKLESSVVLSAGMNRRLYAYLHEFGDFMPDAAGSMSKRIILKVGDFRSARVQGMLLAKQGLWVSEYRIESGLNCGGHAFGGGGALLGPILEEFRNERENLSAQLHGLWREGLRKLGRTAPEECPDVRVTVQGGIGTAEESALLEERYQVDGTGWGSPFLLVPEVVNIDAEHLAKIRAAGEEDVHLSSSSPLGVPFWCLKESTSETARLGRIEAGKPGSACPKGYLVANTEFTKVPICTASRAYQRRKLESLQELDADERASQEAEVMAKACICHDLAGSATVPTGIDPGAKTAICCGPNTVYFSRVAQLREMVDHIYGRLRLPLADNRPHMFLKELSLHLERVREDLEQRRRGLQLPTSLDTGKVSENLRAGIRHYRDLASRLVAGQRREFGRKLENLRDELDTLLP